MTSSTDCNIHGKITGVVIGKSKEDSVIKTGRQRRVERRRQERKRK